MSVRKIPELFDKLTGFYINPVNARMKRRAEVYARDQALAKRINELKEKIRGGASNKEQAKTWEKELADIDRELELVDKEWAKIKATEKKLLGELTPDAEQSRLLIAATIIAVDVGIWTVGKDALTKYIGHHFYTSYVVNFMMFVPSLSALYSFLYLLTTGASLKYRNKGYLGYATPPIAIHVSSKRKHYYDTAIDTFGFLFVQDFVLFIGYLLGHYIHNKVLGTAVYVVFIVGFVRWIAITNRRGEELEGI